MARIETRNDTNILQIRSFLGLNENPDSNTTLKVGELAEMRNFRITMGKHLQIRPGCRTLLELGDVLAAAGKAPGEMKMYGAWTGMAGGRTRTLAAFGGYILDIDFEGKTAHIRGEAHGSDTTFFAFGDKVYLLNGHDYMSWDGGDDTAFAHVEGYVPLVQIATAPGGDGVLLENVNRLTGKRRVRFSPDGTADTFQLPEKNIHSVVGVKINGEAVPGYTADTAAGTVKLSAAPEVGTDNMEVTYSIGAGARSEVLAMRHSELYNGGTDTRVFLYGDGSNRAIYSGVEYDSGQPSAEYFPDLYEMAVGERNTPITALVRHYSRMMAFKPGSAWIVEYGTVALDSGLTTAAFYVQPANRQIGHDVMGQAQLSENSPLTIDGGNIYQWRSSTNGYISNGENNAKRISDRVAQTLRSFDMTRVRTFNSRVWSEFWFIDHHSAVIMNYGNDTWYVYRDLPFDIVLEHEGELYGFTDEGKVMHFSRDYRSDDGRDIECYAATGAMDFGRDWQLKYSPMLFVAMQPEANARITVTVETNKHSHYPEKLVAYSVATFTHVNFAHFSFNLNRRPQVMRLKIKVKKATFYRLVYKSNSSSATATVIGTDIQLRYAGTVKS